MSLLPTENTTLLDNPNGAVPAPVPPAGGGGRMHVYMVRPLAQAAALDAAEPSAAAPSTTTPLGIQSLEDRNLRWAFRESWLTLLGHDVRFVFAHFGALVRTTWLSVSTKPQPGTQQYNPSKLSGIGSGVMLVVSGLLTIPIAATVVVAAPTYLLVRLFTGVARRLQGAPTRLSQPAEDAFVPGHERESWLYVNGIATAPSGAQATINYFQSLFKRPVTAILNRTYGPWFDLWESFLQRDVQLDTDDIRDGYMVLARHVADPTKDRIVLIGHSQGGIIVSAWVDQLLADFDDRILSRVEVYTFASAASHFSRGGRFVVDGGRVRRLDPPRRHRSVDTRAAVDDALTPSNGPFRFVEHFANDGNFVAQLGVLSHKPPAPGAGPTETYGVFAGQIFEREQAGHGILDYYLGLGEGQTSILDVPAVKSSSRLASYIVTTESAGSPLPFDAPPDPSGSA